MYKNKKFAVFGLGISGISTMKYLKAKHINFIAYDDNISSINNIKSLYPDLANNLHDLSSPLWKEIDYLVLSPGIPLTFPTPHPVVKLTKNAKIICDIELLYLDNPNSTFIGITGTNGKSTTTSLIGHILKYNHLNVYVGGNIGVPILDIDNIKKDQIFVIETSSFQLDLLDKTKFNLAVLLNITPDHLDRHGSMANYTLSKYKIFNNQTSNDNAIIHYDLKQLPNSITFSENNIEADVSVINNQLHYKDKIYDLSQNNSLLGKHNQQNLAAAITCCLKFGLSAEKIIASLPSFVGLKHRMQYLGIHNGITFINDSKATNADSTDKALASFDNIIWIVGGVEKEGGILSLKQHFPKIKKALLIGKSSDNFAKTCGSELSWIKCDNLANAFKIACNTANPRDIVLLSPACASYDQWKSFEERGDAFIELFEEYRKIS